MIGLTKLESLFLEIQIFFNVISPKSILYNTWALILNGTASLCTVVCKIVVQAHFLSCYNQDLIFVHSEHVYIPKCMNKLSY